MEFNPRFFGSLERESAKVISDFWNDFGEICTDEGKIINWSFSEKEIEILEPSLVDLINRDELMIKYIHELIGAMGVFALKNRKAHFENRVAELENIRNIIDFLKAHLGYDY